MPNVCPYTFEFNYNPNNLATERRTITVMVEMTRTRSKRNIVRVNDDWEEPWRQVLDVDSLIPNYCPPKDDKERMEYCLFFWDCLRYSAILGLLSSTWVEDYMDYNKIKEFIAELEKPKMTKERNGNNDDKYFQQLNVAFPELAIERLDNGFSG